jgi:hypothetical protein
MSCCAVCTMTSFEADTVKQSGKQHAFLESEILSQCSSGSLYNRYPQGNVEAPKTIAFRTV